MSNQTAAIDTSSKASLTARLFTDGLSIVRITADPTKGALKIQTTTAGAVAPTTFAATDANGRGSMFAVSENDETVLVALQCDSNGALLIKMI